MPLTASSDAKFTLWRSELLGLDWVDVDLDRRLIRVRKAKGGRQRVELRAES